MRFAENIIGDSGIIKQVKARIRKIARFPWPLLIMGESGVGKELAARAVHDLSPRREKPFVPVNCAGLPDSLVESELFGYEKGAFTGAEICKNGKFREADNGTLFLDEIGEASTKFQLTMLRVLENRVITKLGGLKEESVNVRVLCATNKPVEKLVAEMRTDLFHRISTFPLYIKPLRERREDIPKLAAYFIRQFRKEYNEQAEKTESLNISEINAGALSFLSGLYFYGNVRELKNILQRAIMLAEAHETCITEKHIREAVHLIPQPGTDEGTAALRWLCEWAVSNQNRFRNRHRQVNERPPEGWAGRWDIKRMRMPAVMSGSFSSEKDLWEEICFTVKTVRELLTDGGFETKAAIRNWTEQGFLSCSSSRSTRTCRMDNKTVPMYCFSRKVIEKIIV
jgi:transcriptional regulator with GAF, ATPase, and Fis domain